MGVALECSDGRGSSIVMGVALDCSDGCGSRL